jgi:ferrous iron transport protein A
MSIPLPMARNGQALRLVSIEGGAHLRQRLGDMGLTPGTSLRLVQADGGGPLIVAVKDDSRLALGRGMALKIIVEVEQQ